MNFETDQLEAKQSNPNNDWFDQRQPTLADLALILWRRIWVIPLLLVVCVGTALFITHRMTPVWRAHAQLVQTHHLPSYMQGTVPEYQQPVEQTIETQMTMLKDHDMAERALDAASAELKAQGLLPTVVLDESPEQLQNAISVENPHDTDLIDVYVDANTPSKASALANAVCKAFIEWKKEIAQKNTDDALVNLTVRAGRAEAQMRDAEEAQVRYQNANHLVNVAVQTKATIDQYHGVVTSVMTFRQDLATETAKLQSLGGRLDTLDTDIRNGTGVRDDTVVLGLQKQLDQLEIQRAQSALDVTPNYPGILSDLDAQIADIHARVQKAVQTTLDNKRPSLQTQGMLFDQYKDAQTTVIFTQARLRAAQQEQEELANALVTMPQTILIDSRLQRDVDLARSLYTSLQASLNATRLEKDMNSSDVQLVQLADSGMNQVQPRPLLNLAIALVCAMVLGIGAILLLEHSDRRLHTPHALQSVASGPVIGVLPKMSLTQLARFERGELPAAISEAGILAATNLSLGMNASAILGESKPQVILITSGSPGEGKSVTAATIARSLATINRNVVLIDANMRHPALNRYFAKPTELGLSDILEGRTSFLTAVSQVGIPNLQVIHSGTPTGHPTEILASPIIREMLTHFVDSGSTVVIDAPASLVIADGLLLAPLADCILCVVGADHATGELVRATTRALRAAAPKGLVYLLNRATHLPRYDSYYGSFSGAKRSAILNAEDASASVPEDHSGKLS